MGHGDDIMATGMARGAKARGKRIAFGDGRRIIWGPHSAEIFKNNPNVAPPGHELAPDIEWVRYYKGNRIYNSQGVGRWIWNYEFRPIPGEIYFGRDLVRRDDFVVIEPNVPQMKSVAANKQWPPDRFQAVADILRDSGYDVAQPIYDGALFMLGGVRHVKTATFRNALALIATARLYVGPEGGLHHGAAAVGTPAVVLFGGFIPPQITGYDTHENLTGGAKACGSLAMCAHCRAAMDAITVDHVIHATDRFICN